MEEKVVRWWWDAREVVSLGPTSSSSGSRLTLVPGEMRVSMEKLDMPGLGRRGRGLGNKETPGKRTGGGGGGGGGPWRGRWRAY